MQTTMVAAGKDITGKLFNTAMFLVPGIIIVLLIILLVVMVRKKKPKLFYVLNIAFYGLTIGIYSYLFGQLNYIETNISELKQVKLIHDIALLLLAVQVISMLISFIRAVGLDIKKFDFGHDLMELEVQDEDNEEFEVNVNVETNVIKRFINKNVRFAKYIYVENKFLIDIGVLILISAIAFIIYMNMNIYNVVYNQGDNFFAGELDMGVTKSYITQKDYRNKQITADDKSLLIVELYIKASVKGETLNTAKTEVVIDGETYFPTKIQYKYSVFDLGDTYYNEEISTDFEKVLLIYEIPKKVASESMQFKYVNDIEVADSKLNPRYIRTKLTPINLDKNNVKNTAKLGKKITLNDTVLGKTTLKINSYEIEKSFALKYKYCISTSECIDSLEYLKPNLNTNYDKALIKIDASMSIDDEIVLTGVYTPYNLISDFGTLVYKIDGKTYKVLGYFSKVTPYRVNAKNIYYLEVNANILQADNIYLYINVRNSQYQYTLK